MKMCLIIHRPKDCTIRQDWLDNAMEHNPDGWGIMASNGTKLQIIRSMSNKGFARALDKFKNREVFIHFRNATHGTIDLSNCHPFTIGNDQFAVMHNGVINLDTSSDDNYSDTWHYANRFLAPMLVQNPAVVSQPQFTKEIGKHVGPSNKIVILRSDGAHTIVNREQGVEREGCWLSNAYSIALPWSKWASEWSLDDLGSLERDELITLCLDDPESVANAILENYQPFRSRFHDYR
jgi:hypothetical protein